MNPEMNLKRTLKSPQRILMSHEESHKPDAIRMNHCKMHGEPCRARFYRGHSFMQGATQGYNKANYCLAVSGPPDNSEKNTMQLRSHINNQSKSCIITMDVENWQASRICNSRYLQNGPVKPWPWGIQLQILGSKGSGRRSLLKRVSIACNVESHR